MIHETSFQLHTGAWSLTHEASSGLCTGAWSVTHEASSGLHTGAGEREEEGRERFPITQSQTFKN